MNEEYRNRLKMYGFKFDNKDNITNLVEKLKKLSSSANSLTGTMEECAIKNVKEIEEIANKYIEYMCNKEYGKIKGEDNMKNELKSKVTGIMVSHKRTECMASLEELNKFMKSLGEVDLKEYDFKDGFVSVKYDKLESFGDESSSLDHTHSFICMDKGEGIGNTNAYESLQKAVDLYNVLDNVLDNNEKDVFCNLIAGKEVTPNDNNSYIKTVDDILIKTTEGEIFINGCTNVYTAPNMIIAKTNMCMPSLAKGLNNIKKVTLKSQLLDSNQVLVADNEEEFCFTDMRCVKISRTNVEENEVYYIFCDRDSFDYTAIHDVLWMM